MPLEKPLFDELYAVYCHAVCPGYVGAQLLAPKNGKIPFSSSVPVLEFFNQIFVLHRLMHSGPTLEI
jgi:hypothetical protein